MYVHELLQSSCKVVIPHLVLQLPTPQLNTNSILFVTKVCQQLVLLNPCDSESLRLLATVQLASSSHNSLHIGGDGGGDDSVKFLTDAVATFEASLALEGQPAAGQAPQSIRGWLTSRVIY